MALPSLYRLAEQHRELETLGADEELDETTLQAIRDTLDGLSGDIEAKAASVAAVYLNMQAYSKAALEASKALKERAARIDRRADALRQYMHAAMEAAGLTKVECPEFTVSIRKNPPAVQIAAEADLGDEWLVFLEPPPPIPDKRKILQALKDGATIPGCSLTQGTRLEIKA
jgi:hypothetical protein